MNQLECYNAMEKNLCDTIKEWELKIGCSKEPIELYYPAESLMSLLQLEQKDMGLLMEELEQFGTWVQERLGKLEISRKGERFCIRIPKEGSLYVQAYIPTNPFLVRFLEVITDKNSTLEKVEAVFYEFSDKVVKQQEEDREYIFYFEDAGIDEYVYCVEEDDFGLEYHRFTRADYKALFSHK